MDTWISSKIDLCLIFLSSNAMEQCIYFSFSIVILDLILNIFEILYTLILTFSNHTLSI